MDGGVTLAARISYWLDVAGLTQQELATAVGVSASAVSQWVAKKDAVTPTVDNLRKIAEACGISLRTFFGDIKAHQKSEGSAA